MVVTAALLIIGFSQPGKQTINSGYNTPSTRLKHTASLIRSAKMTAGFLPYSLFEFKSRNSDQNVSKTFVRDASYLTLKKDLLQKILKDRPENVALTLPVSGGSPVQLQLTRVNILSHNFKAVNAQTGQKMDYPNDNLYYQGIVNGDESTGAAISIFDNFVMGMLFTPQGTFVLGSVKDANNRYTENYIYYNDRDMIAKNQFKCGVDDEKKFDLRLHPNNNSNHSDHVSFDTLKADTMNIYFETDYDMYQKNNSSTSDVIDFVSGFFNGTNYLYGNLTDGNNIPTQISAIGFWQTPDPYVNDTTSAQILFDFGTNKKDNFFGDLAQFLTTGHGGALGGIAWIGVLCDSAYYDNSVGAWVGRFSFANIDNSYNPLPTYSWTVTVTTHEMGHNYGSHHTHACWWPEPDNTIGPLDTCIVTVENASSQYGGTGCINQAPAWQCFQPDSGTIMSYCHFCEGGGGGIALYRDFGQLPSDTIFAGFTNAKCISAYLHSSETPANWVLVQNYPNPYNPTTTIKFALPSSGFVTLTLYDVVGRVVAKLVNGQLYNEGVFSYNFDATKFNLASGVYLYKLDINSGGNNVFSSVKKMVYLK